MLIQNEYVKQFVEEIAQICQPDSIYWCNGSEDEYQRLLDLAVADGRIHKLNEESNPNSYVFQNAIDDADFSNLKSFLCTTNPEDSSESMEWRHTDNMLEELIERIHHASHAKVLYVVPYLMGPKASPFSKSAIEITDSIYVVLNIAKISRMGDIAWKHLGDSNKFYRAVHITGTLDKENRILAHFPEEKLSVSINTEYGGASIHPKNSHALVLASADAAKESWLAEHMMLLAVETPTGEVHYIAGAFPSHCGKSNMAFLSPSEYAKGYRCYIIGDDIAWLHVGPDGRLWAINPEAGFFSVINGSNAHRAPKTMEMTQQDCIFSNVAITSDNQPYWEGKEDIVPEGLSSWLGFPWDPSHGAPVNHPNARFTASAHSSKSMSPHWEDPSGVPISAIVFGGKTRSLDPLIREARSWNEGVFFGASLIAERNTHIERNPFGILPFLGTSLSSYLNNWITMKNNLSRAPKMFRVNWFRQDANGQYVWPGYKENFRVVEWIMKRLEGKVEVNVSPIGYIPDPLDINLDKLPLDSSDLLEQLLSIDKTEWLEELNRTEEFFNSKQNIPREIYATLQEQRERFQ